MSRNLFTAAWDRWANSHAVLRFFVVVVTFAILSLLVLKPGYRLFKGWRLDRNLVTAQKAVEENRMGEARDLSLAVLRAGDSKIQALRILEKATAGLEDNQHGEISFALVSHPDGTDEDRYNGFKGLVMTSPLGLVGQSWVSFPTNLRQQSRFAILFADRLIQEKHLNEAAVVLLQVPEKERSAQVEQRLIRILISGGKKEGYAEAQKRLASHFPSDEKDLGDWLALLEEIPAEELQSSPLEPIKAILSKPAIVKTSAGSLGLAWLEYASDVNGRSGVIEKAISQWKTEGPVALAAFLDKLGLHQKVLDAIPSSLVATNPTLLAPLLKAMQKTGAWDEMSALLETPDISLPKFEKLAYQAVVATKTGDSSDKFEKWQAAILEAKYSQTLNPYLTLRRIAIESDIPDIAEQMMIEAIRVARGPLPLYKDLMPLINSLAEQGKENVLLELSSIYLTFEPSNPVILTQYSYLACLNNQVAPKTLLIALEPIAKALPKEIPAQFTLATVYLCDNQIDKAGAVVDALEIQPDKLAPSYRAAYLAIQVVRGSLSKTDPSVTEFPWKSLQASERRKFSELIEATPAKEPVEQ